MRWFIALLVVANIILFFWVQQQSRPLSGSSALPPPDVGRLRLMTELNEEPPAIGTIGIETAPVDEEAAMPSVSSFTETQTQTVPVVDTPTSTRGVDTGMEISDTSVSAVEVGFAGQPADRAVDEAGQIPALVGQGSAEGDSPVDVVVEAAGQSVAQARQAASEILVQEVGAETALPALGHLQPAMNADPAVTDTLMPRCTRVGPFNPDDADRLIAGLPVFIELLSDITEEYASVDRYYVMIPPLPSRAAGRKKLKELAEAGVTDTWLFPSGEHRNAISLGFFSREGGAKRHAANIAKKGFSTEVIEKASVRQRRWLFLKSADGGDLKSSLRLPAEAIIEQKACP